MLLSLLLVSAIAIAIHAAVQEAPDGSVCFNNCNGHGDCIDYSCHCWSGYIGDDCGTTFANEADIVPILTAGHFNLTRKNFTQTVINNKLILVGFSSYSCHKCIQAEPSYRNISARLKELKVPFARADAAKMKSIAAEVGATDLPALVLFQKQRPLLYRGVHSGDAVVTYVRKLLEKPVKPLKTVQDVEHFIDSRESSNHGLSTVMVVGFFSEHEDIEEDDYEEFNEAAKELQTNEDVFFGAVTSPKTAAWFKKNKTIDRTPALMVVGEENMRQTINLDELYGETGGIKEWVKKKAIPLVGRMTHQNFPLYEQLRLPILMMFLDLTDQHAIVSRSSLSEEGATADDESIAGAGGHSGGYHIGGKSGGIYNEILLDEFKQAAKEHVDRIVFVYLDGTKFHDQMKSLGLYGGSERLPSLAFNTRDGTQVPFPEELPINRDTILQFCANFISGKLRSPDDAKEMARKALMATVPINPRNKAVRKEVKKAPEQVQGVAERFGDGIRGDDAVVKVTLDNFDDIVLNEDKDVVLLLHAESCESCSHLAVYYKRMADRFRAMQLGSLVIARMDVSHEAPPAHLGLMVGNLPIIAMIPAADKHPPWNFYSGLSKVQQMMKWVHEMASIPFDLENLPHLSEKDKELYKEQVREREEALDKKRTEERRAMEAEERAQAEVKRRQRKREREQQEGGAHVDEDPMLAEVERADGSDGDGDGSRQEAKNNDRLSALLDDHDEF